MDPVSAIGLLASVESLADGAFKIVAFINTIKDGGKQRMRLLTELNSLWMILKLLESHFETEEEVVSEPWLKTINILAEESGVFDQIDRAFDELSTRLQPRSGHRKILQTLKWPFDKPEVDNLVAQVGRLKGAIDTALNSTNAAVVRELQNDTRALRLDNANDEVKSILEWISSLNFLKQQDDFIRQSHSNTGTWFLDQADFQTWLSSKETMLWCPGIPGAGKTFLASIVVDYLKQSELKTESIVLVIYCGYNETKSQSIDNLIAALIKQIIQIRPQISKELKEIYKDSSRTDVFPPLQKLTKTLIAELSHFGSCFIIVDALDEILDEASRVSLLETLIQCRANLMITSRPLDSIRDLFVRTDEACCDECEDIPRTLNRCKQCAEEGLSLCETCSAKDNPCEIGGHFSQKSFVTFEIEIMATEKDVRSYVQWRIDQEPKLQESVARKKDLREEIAWTIVQQANGMFLLARLHMDSLSTKRTPRAIQDALRNLPTKISDTYDQAMQRIEANNEDDRTIAMNFLLWIAFAYRPLGVAEVEHASSIVANTSDVDRDEILSAGVLTSMCAGLVIIDASDIVRLVHFSAQNYFVENRARWFSDGDAIIAQRCITYLMYEPFEAGACSGPTEREDVLEKSAQFPLLEYTASYWGEHAACATESENLTIGCIELLQSRPQLDNAVQVLWVRSPNFILSVRRTVRRRRSDDFALTFIPCFHLSNIYQYSDNSDVADWDAKSGVDALHLAAYFGLPATILRLLTSMANVDIRDPYLTTPLMYAASAGHAHTVKTLLREGASPNLQCSRGSSALLRAISHDHVEVVRLLLDQPCIDVNLPDSTHKNTPLDLAVLYSRSDILTLLLRKPGLDINAERVSTQRTALMHKSGLGDASGIKQLLHYPGILIDLRNQHGSALTVAAKNGEFLAAEILLDNGADPNVREDTGGMGGGTALNRALDDGYTSIVRLLLRRGADSTVLDVYNRTIIHSAAVNGQDECLQVIFAAHTKADVNAQGKNGRTALHDAAYFNFCSTIQILFDNGARTDLHDEARQSPLALARECDNTEAIALLTKLREKEQTNDELRGHLKHTNTSFGNATDNNAALLRAIKLGMVEIAQTYIERSYTDPSIDINCADPVDHHNALQLAIRSKKTTTILIPLLLAHPSINLEIRDTRSRTPLHWSMLHTNQPAATLLLSAGADPNPCDIFNDTPLDIVVGVSDTLVVLLLEHGAIPERGKSENQLQILLAAAAELGTEDLVRRLVGWGADPAKKNEGGWSALHYAEYGGNKAVVRVLLELCEEREGGGR